MSTKESQKKIRIQLYDEEFNHFSDRLVEQDTEFGKGPSMQHKGPLKIEVCLFEKPDIEAFKNYLDQLVGNLPLQAKTPGKRGRPKSASITEDSTDDSRQVFVDNLIGLLTEGEITNQETLIEYLREQGFKFLTTEFIDDLGLEFKPNEEDADLYQWMMPCLKIAKDPANDKYDPKLAVGFKIIGKKIGKFTLYLFGESQGYQDLPWGKENSYNIYKTDMAKFPQYMVQDERDAFRKALRDLKRFPEAKVPKIIKRWYKDVEFAEKEEIEERIKQEED